jgi:hypothetical protein
MEYYVITFASTHSAISTEKHLKQNFKIVVMPTPREISSGCGIAVRFSISDFDPIYLEINELPLNKKMYSIYRFSEGCYTLVS